VADFGLAKLVSPSGMGDPPMKDTGKLPVPPETTNASLVMGTPQYMAPEQVAHPSDVDHRADIYSLGVVFYQMLTGELPKGDFAPPSRKVVLDVRLDEIVLRAMEKRPELRYQQVSDVKTMCETIASTPPTSAETNASGILARNWDLDIGSCLRRGWTLVRGDFWPIIGVTVMVLWLLGVVGILGGPLVGGLCLYYLKKIRGEPARVETAFEGCRIALLQLFLAGLVGGVLTLAGLPCLILPGVFLARHDDLGTGLGHRQTARLLVSAYVKRPDDHQAVEKVPWVHGCFGAALPCRCVGLWGWFVSHYPHCFSLPDVRL